MLARILEPEVMDTYEEARDYDEMDHAEVNRRFVDDLIAAGVAGDVLDLGTGTARIPIELCQRVENCRVMATDLAVAMLDLARLNVEIEGQRLRITLAHLDAKRLPYEEALFDVVMSNSIVHHIPEPLNVLREAARVLKLGGLFFFRDLLRPNSEAELQQLVETYAGKEIEHSQKMFADSLRAALTLDEVRALAAELGFAPNCVEQTSDRHWTWSARKEAS